MEGRLGPEQVEETARDLRDESRQGEDRTSKMQENQASLAYIFALPVELRADLIVLVADDVLVRLGAVKTVEGRESLFVATLLSKPTRRVGQNEHAARR